MWVRHARCTEVVDTGLKIAEVCNRRGRGPCVNGLKVVVCRERPVDVLGGECGDEPFYLVVRVGPTGVVELGKGFGFRGAGHPEAGVV